MSNSFSVFAEWFGWYGTTAMLIAYGLISFGIVQAESVLYQSLNLSGAIGVALICLLRKTYQPAALEIAWALIALVALVRILH